MTPVTAVRTTLADARKIIARATRDFLDCDSLEAGASISFYTLFSVFPLIIVLIPLLGVLLEQQEAQAEVLKMLQRLFPVSQADVVRLMENDLVRIIEGRGSLNIVAMVGLIWAGSNVSGQRSVAFSTPSPSLSASRLSLTPSPSRSSRNSA